MTNFITIKETRLLRSTIKRYQPVGEWIWQSIFHHQEISWIKKYSNLIQKNKEMKYYNY